MQAQVSDGIIEGVISIVEKPPTCPICEKDTWVILVKKITLPDGITPSKRLIIFKDDHKEYPSIGIGCGCYAKFHRQIAHIQSRMKERGSVKPAK